MLFHVFMQHLFFEHLLLPGTVLGTGNTKGNKTHSLPSRAVQCKWSGDKNMAPHRQCENGAFLVLARVWTGSRAPPALGDQIPLVKGI